METTFSENISISKDLVIVGLSDRWGDFLIPKKLFTAIAGSIISKNGRKGEEGKERKREVEKDRRGEREIYLKSVGIFFPSPKQTNGPHKIYT